MQHSIDKGRMQLLLVGGAFDTGSGRPSGYFGKLAAALGAALPEARVELLNGGSYEELVAKLDAVTGVTHLLWFADVPNHLPKVLPQLKARYPGMVLVASKNNRKGLYDRAALYGRMRAARNEFLVEFTDGVDGRIVASVLSAQATVLLEYCPSIQEVADTLAAQFRRLTTLVLPLAKLAYPTKDANSFVTRNFVTDTEIPQSSHPGAFAVVRRHHVHEGVDLYGLPGDAVRAMEAGVVVARRPFTGVAAGNPWWADTECVLIEGASGVLNYGELTAVAGLAPGDRVAAGEVIGHLATVLLKDKGRPCTMLHLERYIAGTQEPIQEWSLGSEQPERLRDPTTLLVRAAANAGAA